MNRRTALVGAMVLLAAIATACDVVAPSSGRITVVAVAGPTCPVETEPPDPACEPRPVADAPITVERAGGRGIVAEGRTDEDGRLTLEVPVGELVVTAGAVEGLMGAPAPLVVVVVEGELAVANLAYDTGIR